MVWGGGKAPAQAAQRNRIISTLGYFSSLPGGGLTQPDVAVKLGLLWGPPKDPSQTPFFL